MLQSAYFPALTSLPGNAPAAGASGGTSGQQVSVCLEDGIEGRQGRWKAHFLGALERILAGIAADCGGVGE